MLINGYSFSASALLSANLKQIKRATFVGQETKLRMGLFPVKPNAHSEIIGRGIFPDQEIIRTIEDVVTGRDKELAWVTNDIKTKR